MEYYSMPLKLDEIMRGKHLEKLDIRLSIHQNIRLILKSFTLSYRYDPTFGCVLNKYQGRTSPQKRSKRAWREDLRERIQKNLKDLLQRYETRIKITDVIVDMRQPEQNSNNPLVKVNVEVTGQLTLGRKEKFNYPDSEIEEEAQELFPLMIPVGK